MDLRPINVLALFAGGGGLELGLRLAVPDSRVVCFVERESFACATLVRQMEEGRLAPCPVWTDVATFDGKPWRGVVDCIAGGFPCQDVSLAGKRAGLDGERSGLWTEYARIVGEVRPRHVFIENVAALTSLGLDRVLADLAALGFDAEWGCLGADDAGAPHGRERIFVLAVADAAGARRSRAEDASPDCDDAGQGFRGPKPQRGGGPQLGHTDVAGLAQRGEPSVRGRTLRHEGTAPFPPGRGDADGWRAYLRQWPSLEPAVCRGADGLAHRVDRLRLLGNGVVPDQAALAWRLLWARIHG